MNNVERTPTVVLERPTVPVVPTVNLPPPDPRQKMTAHTVINLKNILVSCDKPCGLIGI